MHGVMFKLKSCSPYTLDIMIQVRLVFVVLSNIVWRVPNFDKLHLSQLTHTVTILP